MRRVIADNDRELARVAGALDHAGVGTLSHRAHAELDAVKDLLDRRRDGGKVRQCHGDLRLANICLYDGRPTLFDCIEFSEEIGCIDVLYDLAFLLMDLQLRDRGDLANLVFNAYLDAAPETEGLRALPLFLALRTATRAYALAGGAGRRKDPGQAARLMASARRHIAAGIEFLAPQGPILVALGGRTAVERDTIAATLAARMPPVPGARLLPIEDAPAVCAVLTAGCSVLAVGAFERTQLRKAAAALASRLGVPFAGLWLGSPPTGLDHLLWHPVGTAQAAVDFLATLASAPVTPGVANPT